MKFKSKCYTSVNLVFMNVMGWIRQICSKSNFLTLISDDTLVLYDIINDEIKVKFTVKLEKATKAVQQFLENNKNAKIKVVLDPKYLSQKFVTIPDIGSVKTHQAFAEILQKTDDNIVHSTIVHRPTITNPEWKFLIVKANLNKHTKRILKLLHDNNVPMSDLHMALSGHIDLATKLAKVTSRELKLKNDSYCCVYMQNSNGELCQISIQNDVVVDVKQANINEHDVPTYIEENFNKNRRLLIADKISLSKIVLIAILPEQFRSSISEGKNRFFLSANEAVIKLTDQYSARTMTYSSVLAEINFIKSRPEPLRLKDPQPLLQLKTKYQIWLGSVIAMIVILVCATTITIGGYIKTSASIEGKLTILAHLKQESQKLEITSKEKRTLLKNNIRVNDLYQIINSNKYSLDTLTKISNANSKKIPIKRFQYYASYSNPSKHTIEIEISPPEPDQNTGKYFTNIDLFTKNLENSLTEKEVCPFRSEKNFHNSNLPITLKLIDSTKDDTNN